MRDRDSNPRDPDSEGDLATPRLLPERRGPERILGINNAGSAGPDCARQRRSHAQRTARRMRAALITRDRRGGGPPWPYPRTSRHPCLCCPGSPMRPGPSSRPGYPGPLPRSYGCPGLPRLPANPPPAGSRIPHRRCPLVAAATHRHAPQRCTAHGTARHRSKNRTPQPRRSPSCARSPSSEPARPVSSSASA